MPVLLYTAGVVFAFGIVIFVHEFGHFLVAKKSGVKVDQFAFGFGKEIFGFQKGETRYSVNWLPLGGYVKMAGELQEDYEGPVLEGKPAPAVINPNEDHSRDFMAQSWIKRIPIVVAGPIMNYVLAFFIFFLILARWGLPVQINKTEVGEVVTGMPADLAGLKKGDSIVSVEGEPVADFQSVALKIHNRPGLPTKLVLKRGTADITLSLTPQFDPSKKIGLIGIRPADPVNERKKISLFESAQRSGIQCWNITWITMYYLGQKIWAMERPDLASPIGIAQVIVKAVKSGLEDFLYLIGLISVSLGLFNLFPIPLLDGGHVVYYLIEGIRGKPLSTKTIGKANTVGLVLLLSILSLAVFNDVQRNRTPKEKPVVEKTK